MSDTELTLDDWADTEDDVVDNWNDTTLSHDQFSPQYEEQCHENWSDTLYFTNQQLRKYSEQELQLKEQYERSDNELQHTKRMIRALSGLLERQPAHQLYGDRLIQLDHFKDILWDQMQGAALYPPHIQRIRTVIACLTRKLHSESVQYQTQLEHAVELDRAVRAARNTPIHTYKVALPQQARTHHVVFPAALSLERIAQALSIQHNRPMDCSLATRIGVNPDYPLPNRSVIRCTDTDM